MTDDGRRVVPQTKMRRAIGRAMSHSKSTAPHFYVTTDIAMDEVVVALEKLNAARDRSARVSVTAGLIKAVALTLVEEAKFNAHWTEEGHVLLDEVNVGIAIALDEGLIAPALLDCAGADVGELASRLRDLAHRSREGRLRAPEVMGATFHRQQPRNVRCVVIHRHRQSAAGGDTRYWPDRIEAPGHRW